MAIHEIAAAQALPQSDVVDGGIRDDGPDAGSGRVARKVKRRIHTQLRQPYNQRRVTDLRRDRSCRFDERLRANCFIGAQSYYPPRGIEWLEGRQDNLTSESQYGGSST